MPYKRIDVLKAISTTKVAEEERAENTSMPECLAAITPNTGKLQCFPSLLLWVCQNRYILFLVRSAWALSNGCKSRVSPNSGNYIANGKGVHREVKSEGGQWQTSDLTYRNFIWGIWPWMRLLNKSTSHSYSERLVEFPWAKRKNEVDIRWKDNALIRGALTDMTIRFLNVTHGAKLVVRSQQMP